MDPVRQFKFACPVCGQHLQAAAEEAGRATECPSCFKKLTVPQAPTDSGTKLIITAALADTRRSPVPNIPAPGQSAPAPAKSKGRWIYVVLSLLALVAVGAVLYALLSGTKGGLEVFQKESRDLPVGQPVLADGVYKLINRNSGKVLNVGSGRGANVDQRDSTGDINQKWTLKNIGGNRYHIINNGNPRYLDVSGISTDDGANVVVWDSTGNPNQIWIVEPVSSSSGWFTVKAAHSNKLLEVYDASGDDGANVVQWTANGGLNQQWSFQAQ